MPGETEELVLRVRLDDQASATLQRVKQSMTDVTYEKFKRSPVELGVGNHTL
jgi:hypothetical protein